MDQRRVLALEPGKQRRVRDRFFWHLGRHAPGHFPGHRCGLGVQLQGARVVQGAEHERIVEQALGVRDAQLVRRLGDHVRVCGGLRDRGVLPRGPQCVNAQRERCGIRL